MFAVFGKSLKHEQVKKGSFLSSPEYRFAKKRGAYQISPTYSSIEMAQEFVKLSIGVNVIRCDYIAKLEQLTDKRGEPILNKKTRQPKVKYLKFLEIKKDQENETV